MSSGIKISELTAASTFTGSEVLPVVQSSTTLKGSVDQITTYVAAATATLTNKTISGAANTITNISLTSAVTGTLAILNGGTGATTATTAITNLFGGYTGTGDAVRKVSPGLTTPHIGVATFTSLYGTATPSITVNWVTAYTSRTIYYTSGTATSTTLPALSSYTELYSNSGYANRATAYRIGSGILVYDSSGAAGNSADLYGINPVVHGYAGTGGNLLTAAEFNVNNLGAAATTLGANNSAYGAVAAPGGVSILTAAFWAAGANVGWQYGFAASYIIGGAGFWDESNSPTVLGGTGTHTYGVDFSGMTLTTAFKSNAFSVDGSGNIAGATYALGSTTLAANGSGYNILYDGSSRQNVFLGGTGDPTNYYRNANHKFQTVGAAATILDMNGSAAELLVALKYGGKLLANTVTGNAGGSLVSSDSPTLTTPNLGTPSTITLTNGTGLPVSTGISGLGTGVATALAVGTGTSGAFVVNGGALGTPSSGNLANATGLPISTGVSGLATGIATFLATPTSANLASAVTNETGSGALVFGTQPQFTTGIGIGTASLSTANLYIKGPGTATNYSIFIQDSAAATKFALQDNGDLTYGGVTFSGVSGSGKLAGTASPTFTGTVTAATLSFSSALTPTGDVTTNIGAGGARIGTTYTYNAEVSNLLKVTSGAVLQLGNAYVAGAPAATGYVTLKDSAGTTYKVLVST